MTGYDSSDLTGMMEKVTAGATGALGNIVMTGYDSDDLTGMMEKVTAGATGALGNISMTGYDSSDLTGMMEKVTAGATGALGNIVMTGYDSSDLTGMMEKVTAGATGALGNIVMTGYSSDNLTGMMDKMKEGAVGAMDNFAFTGSDGRAWNPNTDNFSSSITAGANAGLTFSGTGIIASGTVTGDDNLTGIFNMSYHGQEPSGGCIDNSTAVADMITQYKALPSDTLGFKKQIIITSSTTFTQSMQYYSDASCGKLTGYLNLLFDNLVVGDSLSGLNAGSNPAKPTTAKKISYNHPSMKLKSITDNTTAYFLSLNISVTKGIELVIPTSEPIVNIAETGAMPGSSKTYFFIGSPSATTYPTGWTGASVYWQE